MVYESICATQKDVDKLCVEEAQESPAVKRKVGAILVFKPNNSDEYRVIARGHNYNPNDVACEYADGSTKPEVVHAEIACIRNFMSSKVSIAITWSTPTRKIFADLFPSCMGKLEMFVSYKPCANCQAELDRLGIEAIVSNGFMKFDSQKPRMALVPASLGIGCARALTYGAKKYKPNNWRLIDNTEQYISALTRHLDAWREGEENDPESGLCHLDHVAANLSFLLELKSLPKIKL